MHVVLLVVDMIERPGTIEFGILLLFVDQATRCGVWRIERTLEMEDE